MTTPKNTTRSARLQPAVQHANTKRRGRYWPWALAGLLIVNAAAVGTLIFFSGSSATHSVEPDYYTKATKWDATMAQERANLALGWHLRARAVVTGGAVLELSVRVLDASGAPIEGAAIKLEAFHNARSSARIHVALREVEPGLYQAAWDSSRLGLWQLRLSVARGAQLFTATEVVDVAASDATPKTTSETAP